MIAAVLLLCCAFQAGSAPGVQVRRAASDYAAHGDLGELTLAAEYQFRAVRSGRDNFLLRSGLVIEVAFFGPERRRFDLRPADFWIRVNGKKRFYSENPGLVMSHERLGSSPSLDIHAGDGNIRIGGNPEYGRHPGDRTPPPRPVEIENPNRPAGSQRMLEDALVEAALPEGKQLAPVAGLLYFHYPKKAKSIKKLELIYTNPAGEAVTLKLK